MNAQRPWQLVDPIAQYYFEEDSTSLLYRNITEFDTTIGSDYILELNRIARFKPDNGFCCDTSYFNSPGPLGYTILVDTHSNITRFSFYSDTILLDPNAGVGDTAIVLANGTILRVDSSYADTIYGVLDSIKEVNINGELFFRWSRSFGILSYRPYFDADNKNHLQIGEEVFNRGWQYPSLEDLYPYFPGDVIETTGGGGQSGDYTNFTYQFSVLRKWDSTGVLYIEGIRKSRIESYWSGLATPDYVGISIDTLILTKSYILENTCVRMCNRDLRNIFSGHHLKLYSLPELYTPPNISFGGPPNMDAILNVYIKDTFPYITISGPEYDFATNSYASQFYDLITLGSLHDSCSFTPSDTPIARVSAGRDFGTLSFLFRFDLEAFSYSEFEAGCGSGISGYQSTTHPALNFGYLSPPEFFVVGLEEKIKPNLSIHPNPTSSTLHLSYPEAFEQAQIIIYDMLGQQVAALSIAEQETDIDVSELSTGYYILEMIVEGNSIRKKFSKR